MKKLLTGFCMCWGMFCYIPGPKKWNEESRPYMLAWLPSVGAVMGAVWALCYWLMSGLIVLPVMAMGAVMVWLPLVLSGFIHVDGYMDVNDAVLSRGSLEKKRAILKDSRCGTFAIVSFVFLILIDFAFMCSSCESIDPWRLVLIMSVSRSFSGLMMMNLEPMDTSQYKAMQRDDKANPFLILQVVVIIGLAIAFGVSRVSLLITATACMSGTLISIMMARHELQGMNGDIAGYGILWGELLGIISLVF